jgi:hypothetical protein
MAVAQSPTESFVIDWRNMLEQDKAKVFNAVYDFLTDKEIPKIVQQTYDQTKGNKDIVSVNFLVNHDAAQGTKSDLREYYRILKTVLKFTNDYVNKFDPFIVLIIAEEATSDKNTKNQFYSNIISRNINPNYRIIDNVKMKDGHKGYMLMRAK